EQRRAEGREERATKTRGGGSDRLHDVHRARQLGGESLDGCVERLASVRGLLVPAEGEPRECEQPEEQEGEVRRRRRRDRQLVSAELVRLGGEVGVGHGGDLVVRRPAV